MLFGIILGVIILVLLVVIHELGHAIVARRNGVVVEEFGVGFPPRAWARKLKNGMVLSLNWLPLGGFVKLQGEHDAANKKGDYGAATFWQKTNILLAGVVMNWVVAAVLLTVLALTGLPKIVPDQFSVASDTKLISSPIQVVGVQPDSPAEKAGLKIGDTIQRVGGVDLTTAVQLSEVTKKNAGELVHILYSRDGQSRNATAVLRTTDKASDGYLGISQGQQQKIRATWSAPIVGIATTGQLSWLTLKGVGETLGSFVSGVVMQFSPNDQTRKDAQANLNSAKNNVAGPVGVVGTIFPAAEKAGPTQLIFLTAIISLTLAVMNILPIPALDGGRWYTMAIFRLLRKKLTKEREERIQATGFLVLLGLIVLVTIADIGRLL